MAETHELRLKIDAGAAKSGSRDFTGAIAAVRNAVRGLERDSEGAFKNINKHMKALSGAHKINLGIDKNAIRDLNAFADMQKKVAQATATTDKTTKSLAGSIRAIADTYKSAKSASDSYLASILKVNTALQKQAQIGSQVRSGGRTASTVRTTAAAPSTPRMPAGGGDAVVSQARIQRAMDNTRLTAERMTTALMKIGAFESMSKLHRAVSAFQKTMSGASVTSSQFANAQNVLASAVTNARVSLTTMTAKVADAKRTENEAANAARHQAELTLASGNAMHKAELDAARLVAQLHKLGDTSGIAAINAALGHMRSTVAGGVGSAHELRTAYAQFNNTLGQTRVALIAANTAEANNAKTARILAAEERQVAMNARAVEREMRSIAGASNAASAALHKATGNMRGLENAFSGTFQAGTLFRNLLGSLTLGVMTRNLFQAGNALDQFMVTMEVATGSVAGANAEMSYIDNVAATLGTNLLSARDNYSKFAISADIAGVSAQATQRIFESVSTAMAVLGKGTEDQNLAFLALEQMMSKGTISSEELRRQLGERLPGAVNMMAQALGVTTEKLQDMLKAGEISSADALPKFAEVLMQRFGPGLQAATRRAGYNLGTLTNEVTKFQEVAAQSGFMQTLSVQFGRLTEAMRSPEATEAAMKLGEGFALAAEMATDALLYIVENINTVGTVIKAVAAGIVVRQLTLMGSAFVMAGGQVAAFVASLMGSTSGAAAASAATNAHTLALNANSAALARNAVAGTGAAAAATRLAAAESAAAAASAVNASRMATVVRIGSIAARGLGAMAGPIGLAVAGLTLLPALFGNTQTQAYEMSNDLEAALRRSGIAFEDLAATATTSMATIRLQMQLEDSGTLITQRGSAPAFFAGVESRFANGPSSDTDMLDSLGLSTENYDRMTQASRSAVAQLVQANDAVEKLDMTYLELRDKMRLAARNNPDGAAFFRGMETGIAQDVQRERAVTGNREFLIESMADPTEMAKLELARLGRTAIDSGGNLSAYLARAREIVDEGLMTAREVRNLEGGLRAAMTAGQSGDTYAQYAINAISPLVGQMEQAAINLEQEREAASIARASLQAAALDYRSFELAATTGGVAGNMPTNITGSIGELLDNYASPMAAVDDMVLMVEERSVTASVAVDELTARVRDLATNATDTTVGDGILKAFESLPEHRQNFLALTTILDTFESHVPQSLPFMADLREAVREGGEFGVTVKEMEAALTALGINAAPGTLAAGFLDAARAAQNADRSFTDASYAAEVAAGNIRGAAGAANAIGTAAGHATGAVSALRAALASLFGMGAASAASAAGIIDAMNERVRVAGMSEVDRFVYNESNSGGMAEYVEAETARIAEADTVLAGMQYGTPEFSAAVSERAAIADRLAATTNTVEDSLRTLYELENADTGGGGSGGGEDAFNRADEIRDVMEGLQDDLVSRREEMQRQVLVLSLLAAGQVESAEGAELLARAMMVGNAQTIEGAAAAVRLTDAYVDLGDQLQALANNPVKEFQDSVPSFIEASNTIQTDAIGGLQSAFSEFFKSGELSAASFVDTMRDTFAQLLADQSINGLMKLFKMDGSNIWGVGNRGDLAQQALSGATAVAGDPAIMSSATAAGTSIGTSMINAGTTVAQMFTAALQGGATSVGTAATMGGVQMATGVQTAGSTSAATIQSAMVAGGTQAAGQIGAATAGGAATGASFLGGFNPWSALISAGTMLVGSMSQGGISNGPMPATTSISPAAFFNAPHYAEGTPNTSGGIPAVLHDNEAVVPLSKGRKIPVDLGGANGGSNVTLHLGEINVSVESRGDEESDAELAHRVGTAMRSSVSDLIDQKLMEQLAYGGALNQRGMG